MSTNNNDNPLKNKASFKPEQPELPKKDYHLTWQGNGVNQITAITQKKVEQARAEQISLFGKEEGYNKPVRVVSGEVEYTISNRDCVFTGRTWQVLLYLTSKFTEQALHSYTKEDRDKARYVELAIKEISQKFELTNLTSIREMVTRELFTISEIWAEWYEYIYYDDDKTGKKKRSVDKEHFKTRLIGLIKETTPAGEDAKSKPQIFKRGKVTVRIDEDFAKYLENSYEMAVNDKFYSIVPKKNPYSVALCHRLMTHYRKNRGKPNQNIIRVKNLLQFTDIPRYEDIAEKGRINQLIFEPFERDMDKLQELGLIKFWDYCKPNGVHLTQAERQKMTGKQFESYDVYFEMPDEYPTIQALPPLPPEEDIQ